MSSSHVVLKLLMQLKGSLHISIPYALCVLTFMSSQEKVKRGDREILAQDSLYSTYRRPDQVTSEVIPLFAPRVKMPIEGLMISWLMLYEFECL